jgi:hypothetical protein
VKTSVVQPCVPAARTRTAHVSRALRRGTRPPYVDTGVAATYVCGGGEGRGSHACRRSRGPARSHEAAPRPRKHKRRTTSSMTSARNTSSTDGLRVRSNHANVRKFVCGMYVSLYATFALQLPLRTVRTYVHTHALLVRQPRGVRNHPQEFEPKVMVLACKTHNHIAADGSPANPAHILHNFTPPSRCRTV